MRAILLGLWIFTFSCNQPGGSPQSPRWSQDLPVYDHIVIVVEENKYYHQIVGNIAAPFFNDVLIAEGANLTQMYAEEHNSEGNYFWLFSGGNQGVGFNDVIPDAENSRRYPFVSSNLGAQLLLKGLTFKGYSEDLPEMGSTVSHTGFYARKHVPWISFGNLPNGTRADSSCNLQFRQFPRDFTQLPTVSFVIPNLVHDMHDPPGDIALSVKTGDAWLAENIGPYYQWAKTHNSLLIVTFDENADSTGYVGLTDPSSEKEDIRNRIPTVIAGARIRQGNFEEGRGVTHVNLLRTIEAMYGLQTSGEQQPFAARFGIPSDYLITDLFVR